MKAMLLASIEKLKFALLIYFAFCALIATHGTVQAEDCSQYAYRNPYDPDDGGKAIIDCLKRQNKALMQSIERSAQEIQNQFNAEPSVKKKIQPGPAVGFNPTRGEMMVNGYRFHVDDENAALKSIDYLDLPRKQLPYGFDYLGPNEYGAYIRSIKNGTRPKNAFRKAEQRRRNAPNYWECILKNMENIDNDIVARKIRDECQEKAPNKSSKNNSSMFGINNADKCVVEFGKSSASNLAAKEIRHACEMLYPL